MPFVSPQSLFTSKQEKFYWRCTPPNSRPQSRDTPPKRYTGIAIAKDWEIDLLSENVNESGTNEDGSSWFRESGEDLGENGYTLVGESDWSGYKGLGLEKSGRNVDGDSWWETWREVLYQDELRWEKYDAKGWTEKGAHKWPTKQTVLVGKMGRAFDGKRSVIKCTDKRAEAEVGTKWGDKWEEKFFSGIGARQGENWHVSPGGERWSMTWGEEHLGNGKVHTYGKSTTGKNWDIIVDEETCYEAKPHYGWADVVGNSTQLLSIQPRERPSGFHSNLDFILAPLPPPADSPDPAPSPFQ